MRISICDWCGARGDVRDAEVRWLDKSALAKARRLVKWILEVPMVRPELCPRCRRKLWNAIESVKSKCEVV